MSAADDPVERLVQQLTTRRLRAHDLAQACVRRIERANTELHAFLRLDPRIEEQAAESDRRLDAGSGRALEGIPVALKDNLLTAGLETSCGSRILRGYVPLEDATVVARLRDAGAVILGKTNLDEFAMGSSTENSAFGPTRNPWDRTRVPGGSSGGSAAAVSARLAPLALGSDTGGSVRQPAAFCGIVGLKPTYGRVSRRGLVAFGSSLDQVGPLAASVRGAARLLGVIAGADERDMTCSTLAAGDYEGACERGVEGLRVGLPREYFGHGLDPEIEAAVRAAASQLERCGARLCEVALPHTRFAIPAYYLVATAEASSNLARFDGVRYGPRVDPGAGLQAMYRATRGGGFGAEVQRRIMLGTYALTAGYYAAFYGKAMAVRARLRADFLEAFRRCDALIAPVTPSTAFRLGEKVDDPLSMYLSDVYTATGNLAGLPALAVPVGRSRQGLPIGGQLIGPAFCEETLFRAAAVLERWFAPSPPPAFAEERAA
ncbi:MAG TPA: Asp-tRNA(Asn)/Glu-tRNA(Gln) amidotransferase subunit GatA [Candidatus Polarisedimenticolaceae bacterium]|nr:Asp-tRNA(Asn)/Glu-tRNA(Gln) amidotransferase subunit GatA [Candidatus Polarisedimenticolaceae bacterium]